MSIHFNPTKKRYIFEFTRQINGKRYRLRKQLPKTWNRHKAETFDIKENSRLFAVITGTDDTSATIEQAVNLYITHHLPTVKSPRKIATELANIHWLYKNKSISELKNICLEYQNDFKFILAPATILKRIRYLTAACRYAWKYHNICENNPAELVILPKVNNERRYFLSRYEMLKLAKSTDHRPTRAYIRIAFYSGMRENEIRQSTINNNNFELSDTKNKEPRIIPIHPKIKRCIKYKQIGKTAVAKNFRIARDKAKMEHIHFHDLRHSAASELINNNVDLYTVGAILGHRSAQSTKRYAHLAVNTLKSAIEKIGNTG